MTDKQQGAAPTSDHLQKADQPAGEPAGGDYRGQYGYGHAAYKPDPGATYTFKPDTIRPLPLNAKARWR